MALGIRRDMHVLVIVYEMMTITQHRTWWPRPPITDVYSTQGIKRKNFCVHNL